MKKEHGLKVDEREQDFKNLVYANNPKLYFKMFEEIQKVDEDQVEYFRPETVGDVANVLQELKQFGVNLEMDPNDGFISSDSAANASDEKESPLTH